ncbi:kin of IRRE-like protein 3 [Clonorchis sinensis]|nr:kin of IRRE-like protein 3 [Clonorchis sinensis]
MHNAVFRCIAISNKKGHTETTVRVKFGPQFLEPSPLLFTASVGEDIAMECPARGNPTPRIDWRREGGHEVLHRGVTYRKDSLRDDDFGTYICTAYVSEFPPVSKQMYISKRRPPTIQPNPVVHAKLGRTARLRCTVNSVPLPPPDQTHWYFNGRPVRQDNHHTFEREEFLGGVVLILQIAHVMRTDYGRYNCTVRNGYGSDWKLIELSQQEDIPLQFIVGSAIAVGILIVVGLIILCACRQRICGGKYTKGRQNQNSSTSMRPVQAPFSEYGVINSEFKAPLSSQNGSYRSSYSPWYPNATVQPQTSYIGCGSDTDEQRSVTNGPKFSQEKYFYDDSKVDTCPNPSMPVGISSAYCPNMSSCQLIQPLCNGGGYISTIDARFLQTTQPTYITGCPTFISGAAMVGSANQPDFIPETISLQPLDSLGGGCLFTTADGHQVTTVPQIATLDLTNHMPHHLTTPSIYSGDAASGTSSVDQVQNYANHSKGELSDNARSPSHSGSGSMQFRQQTVNLPSSITLGVQPELHGISYVINEHTTNV